MDKKTGLCKGYGFITCDDEQTFQRIMSKTDHKIDGRIIDCNIACKKVDAPDSIKNLKKKKIFVGGLSPETTNDSLKDYFNKLGKVKKAYIIKDHKTGKSKNFGFVEFKYQKDAEKLVKKQHILNGQKLTCTPFKESEPEESQDDCYQYEDSWCNSNYQAYQWQGQYICPFPIPAGWTPQELYCQYPQPQIPVNQGEFMQKIAQSLPPYVNHNGYPMPHNHQRISNQTRYTNGSQSPATSWSSAEFQFPLSNSSRMEESGSFSKTMETSSNSSFNLFGGTKKTPNKLCNYFCKEGKKKKPQRHTFHLSKPPELGGEEQQEPKKEKRKQSHERMIDKSLKLILDDENQNN